MILTKELWDYIIKKQRILDAAFMQDPVFAPNEEHRAFAMMVEVDEFVKEFREEYKWWSNKKNDRDRIADEYVDIMHFAAGLAIYQELENAFYIEIELNYNINVDEHLKDSLFDNLACLRKENSIYLAVARATTIMERIGFTTEELREAYDRKNETNFKRIEAGY